MSNASIIWRSDDKDVIASLQKMEKELQKVKDELKNVKHEGKHSGEEVENAFTEAASEVKGLITGLFTVERVVEGVSLAYEDWAEHVDSLAERHREFSENLIRTLTKTGDLMQADKIGERLSNIPGATKEQGMQAFAGIHESSPASPLEHRLQLAEQFAALGATGIDMREFGQVGGEISDLLPTKSANDVADLTAYIQSKAGSDFQAFSQPKVLMAMQSLQKSGAVGSIEEAVGLSMAAMDANISPKSGVLESVAELVDKKFKPEEIKDASIAKFAAAKPPERYQMLRSDSKIAEAVMPGGLGLKFSQIPEQAVQARTEEARVAQRQDFAKETVSKLEQSEAGNERLIAQNIEIKKDKDESEFWAEQSKYSKNIDESMKHAGFSDPFGIGYMSRTISVKSFQAATVGGQDPEQAAIDTLKFAKEQVGPMELDKAGESTGRLSGTATREQRENFEFLEKQIRILERIEANQRKRAVSVDTGE